jgi:hypothetical protein
VVDAVLAAATADLSARTGLTGIQLKSSSYASVAIDAEGLHVVSNRNEPTGLVPASTLEVAGLSRATLGTREVTSLVLRATTPTGTVDLPLVPMRLHGNPLRFLTPAEFDALSARVAAALRGERIEEPGWAF